MFELKTEACEVGGHLKVRVTVADADGRVVDGELVAPFNGRQRRAAAERMAARVAPADAQEATAEEIERRVLEAADAYRGDQKEAAGGEKAPAIFDEEEADANGPLTVVRPELFVTPAVVGVSVPETVREPDGELSGRWRVYAAVPADGRRWRGPLAGTLAIPGVAGELYVRPVTPGPALPTFAAWGRESRKAWVEGKEGPGVREVFAEVYGAMDEFLDVGQGEGNSKDEIRMTNEAPNSKDEIPNGGGGGATDVSNLDIGPSNLIRHSNFNIRISPPHPVLSTLTLWTLLTYCYPAWDAVPYLYVGGPAGSGKTRVFELLSRLVFRPLASSNVSAPALFRTLHDRGGTLLLDEAERLKEGAPEVAEVRSILLAGYKRGGRASRLESSGDTYRMQEFDVFGPKAIACINGVEGPLATRCVGVQMIRSAPDSPRPRRRIDRDPSRWQRLRDMLHECLLGELGKAAPTLSERPDLCPLGGRAGEIWQPLLALATLADPEGTWGLHRVVAAHAAELAEQGKDEHFPDEDLVALAVLTKKILKGETPTAMELLTLCQAKDEKLFARWTAKKVACCLRTYGIRTTKTRTTRQYRITIDHLRVIEKNYGIDLNTEGRTPEAVIRPY